MDADLPRFKWISAYVLVSFSLGALFSCLVLPGAQLTKPTDITLEGPDTNQLDVKMSSKELFGESSGLLASALQSATTEFSCNVLGALENLSKLHSRRVDIEKRNSRGEANNIRIANLKRKTDEAVAAERAMRTCMQSTLPEVLKMWDEELAKNKKLGRQWWTEAKEATISGIDIKVLEETADLISSDEEKDQTKF